MPLTVITQYADSLRIMCMYTLQEVMCFPPLMMNLIISGLFGACLAQAEVQVNAGVCRQQSQHKNSVYLLHVV